MIRYLQGDSVVYIDDTHLQGDSVVYIDAPT